MAGEIFRMTTSFSFYSDYRECRIGKSLVLFYWGLNESIYYSQDEEENEEMFHSIIDPVDVHNNPPEDMFHSMISDEDAKRDPGRASSSRLLESNGEQFYSAILNPSSNSDMFYSTVINDADPNQSQDLNESILINKDAVLNQFSELNDSDSESLSPNFDEQVNHYFSFLGGQK